MPPNSKPVKIDSPTYELPTLDVNKEYYVSPSNKSAGFTMLMRLIASDPEEEYREPNLSAICDYIGRHPEELDKPCASGRTPLMLAVGRGLSKVVKVLLDAGADANCKGQSVTAIGVACNLLNYTGDMVSLKSILLHTNSDVLNTSVFSNISGTPLMICCDERWANYEAAKLLIAAGADVNKTDNSGERTALSLAIEAGQTALAELLIAKGADVNKRLGKLEMTPLMLAVKKNNVVIVQQCLRTAHINIKNTSGQTALAIACDKKFTECNLDIIHAILAKHHYQAYYENIFCNVAQLTASYNMLCKLRSWGMYCQNSKLYNSILNNTIDLMIKLMNPDNIQQIIGVIPKWHMPYFMKRWEEKCRNTQPVVKCTGHIQGSVTGDVKGNIQGMTGLSTETTHDNTTETTFDISTDTPTNTTPTDTTPTNTTPTDTTPTNTTPTDTTPTNTTPTDTTPTNTTPDISTDTPTNTTPTNTTPSVDDTQQTAEFQQL